MLLLFKLALRQQDCPPPRLDPAPATSRTAAAGHGLQGGSPRHPPALLHTRRTLYIAPEVKVGLGNKLRVAGELGVGWRKLVRVVPAGGAEVPAAGGR